MPDETDDGFPVNVGFGPWEEEPYRHPLEPYGLSRLRSWLAPALGKELNISAKRLYHYTTAAGLLGILSSHIIRGTNFSFLNDTSEFVFGRDVVVKATMAEASEFSPNDWTVRQTLARVLERFSAQTERAEIYVSCFSAACDLLSQWRAYGTSSGRYCIEIDPSVLVVEQYGSYSPFYFAQVTYDTTAQEKMVRDYLRYACQALREDESAHDEIVERGSEYIVEDLFGLTPFFKHNGFIEESEWRAVMVCDKPNGFEATAGMLRPFVNLLDGSRLAQKRLPITRVMIGAGAHPAEARKAVRMLLDTCGYDAVVIDQSTLPFRG